MTVCNRPQDQVAKAMLNLPWYIVNNAIASVKKAEAQLLRPPSIFECFTIMVKEYNLPVKSCYEGAAILFSLYREDWLYMNTAATHYSTQPIKGFKTYSQQFREKYGPGYNVVRDGTVGVTTAKTINFKTLMEVLKSKDASLLEKNKWMFDGDFKFCDGENMIFDGF